MSTAEQRLGEEEGVERGAPELGVAPDPVQVRRRAGVAALVGAASSAIAIAYLSRAAATGSVLDWALVALMGLLAVLWLRAFLDARTPLLVADHLGVRMRLGRTWRGLPWSAVRHVEHRPRQGLLHDGRITVVPHNPERLLEELEGSAARQARWSTRLYDAPLAVPLGLGTRVDMTGADLSGALARLAGEAQSSVVVVDPADRPSDDEFVDEVADEVASEGDGGRRSLPRPRDPRPFLAGVLDRLSALLPRREETDADPRDDGGETLTPDRTEIQPSATPAPARPVVEPLRAEAFSTGDSAPVEAGPDEETALLERAAIEFVELVEDDASWADRVTPIAREGHAVPPLVLDDFAAVAAEDPVIGPELRAARTRLRLSVEELAERTRIRPHVIEAIEVDDFVPCGGDFYARGHLRTLARVLGVDVAALLVHYDERYSHAPVDPRRVFEAELATGAHGSIRGTRGGPNWSVLVAAVMAVVLLWSVARLIMDAPTELRGAAPALNGSGGPHGGGAVVADPVEVLVTAPTAGSRVVIRDGNGEVVFQGGLAIGESRTVKAPPPLRVQASDGSVTVTVGGVDRGAVGEAGQMAQGTYAAD